MSLKKEIKIKEEQIIITLIAEVKKPPYIDIELEEGMKPKTKYLCIISKLKTPNGTYFISPFFITETELKKWFRGNRYGIGGK